AWVTGRMTAAVSTVASTVPGGEEARRAPDRNAPPDPRERTGHGRHRPRRCLDLANDMASGKCARRLPRVGKELSYVPCHDTDDAVSCTSSGVGESRGVLDVDDGLEERLPI